MLHTYADKGLFWTTKAFLYSYESTACVDSTQKTLTGGIYYGISITTTSIPE